MSTTSGGELSTSGRFVSAAGASIVSAIVVNPFDVVKTRLQAQAAQQSLQLQSPSARSSSAADPGSCRPSCSTSLRGPHAADCNRFSSTLDGMQKIVRKEGIRALWRGLDASLAMAVPAVGIYMPLYDIFIQRLDQSKSSAPLLAGAAARMVAVLCTSPLELVRTRTQAVFQPQSLVAAGRDISVASRSSQTWSQLLMAASDLSRLRRVQLLWRGVSATLARDVPFSAAYWGLLEPIRQSMLPQDRVTATTSRTMTANMIAGALGGATAAAITQPLDVIKTRMQLADSKSRGILAMLREVVTHEGPRGLFAGVTPRAMKAAPACAIVLASYECMKLAVAKPGHEEAL